MSLFPKKRHGPELKCGGPQMCEDCRERINESGLTGLIGGGPLLIEDLDISGLGLYKEKDPNVPDEDYIDSGFRWFGEIVWYRKSEEGAKWHSYNDSKLKNWSELLKKDDK